MIIRELNSDLHSITVTLNYDECRCLCNSLYQVSQLDTKKESDFNLTYAKVIEMFALVKHGMIPEFEMRCIYNLICKNKDITLEGENQNE